jgi:thiol-disulfide isomerase/thioredoxin
VFWIAVGVLVAIGVTIAIVGSGGSDSKKATGGGNATAHEFGKVTVTGDPLPPYPRDRSAPAVGMKIPTLTGRNFAGQPVTIAPTGTPQMVVFLAHWCPHCNVEAPKLGAYLKDNGGPPPGVDLAIVPTGSNATAPNWPPSQWVKDMGLGGVTTLVDDKAQTAAAAYGLTYYPYIVLVDKAGTVVNRFSGEQGDGFFKAAFDALAAGTPIPTGT